MLADVKLYIVSISRARVLGDYTLRIENVESSDEGVYVCTAENAAGSTKATAKLNVFGMSNRSNKHHFCMFFKHNCQVFLVDEV